MSHTRRGEGRGAFPLEEGEWIFGSTDQRSVLVTPRPARRVAQSKCVGFSVVSDSATPWTVAARLLCPWDSPGKNTVWVAIPFSRDLPKPGSEPGSSALQADSLPSEPPGKSLLVITGFSFWWSL